MVEPDVAVVTRLVVVIVAIALAAAVEAVVIDTVVDVNAEMNVVLVIVAAAHVEVDLGLVHDHRRRNAEALVTQDLARGAEAGATQHQDRAWPLVALRLPDRRPRGRQDHLLLVQHALHHRVLGRGLYHRPHDAESYLARARQG